MNSMQGKYFGTKFAVNMWKPEVQVPNEFSLAQTWLVSGVGTTRNTIEAGLQVFYFFGPPSLTTYCSYAKHLN